MLAAFLYTMRMKQFIPFLFVVFLFACQLQPKENAGNDAKTDTAKVSESIRTNTSFLYDYKALEEVFTNDNWLLAGKNDSSYFYFSRLGDFRVNTYEYKLVKGDSAAVKHTSVQKEGDKIVWAFNNQKLYLTSATKARAVWAVAGADSLQYEFLRINENQLALTYPDKHKLILQKTLPFSLFLVRSRYDFTHGTRYAFDNTPSAKQK